jgi:Rne/Rng family ribonuclease
MDILIEELEGSIWAAAMEDGLIVGLEAEPIYEEVRWGSVYWAKVKTIDAALDAAYLDIDGYNTGILYNKDVRTRDKKGKVIKGGDTAIGKVFQPGQMIAVQAKSSYLPKEEDDFARPETKMPEMSMDITLPGRYLIYCSMMEGNRISMRIRDKTMRKQLMAMAEQMEDIEGYILRAAAADTQTDVLVREGKILRQAWQEMQEHLEGDSGQLIMLGPDAIQRTLSDQANQRIERIEITTMDHYKYVEEWCSIFAPDLITKIEPVELKNAVDDLALFHERDIMGQVENLFQAYAFLPSGGNLIIQDTAALASIDVNKGADKRGHLATNIEAAKEIARQVKLRNTGGVIMVDFLNMKKNEQEKLIAALEEEINEDPCTIQLHGFTKMGLMEMTRKRRTPPLQDRFEGIIT